MRNVIYGINITIDGCCDHTKGIADEDIHAYFGALMLEADVLVYGRKTYELMVPFWPDMAKNPSGEEQSMVDFAQAFDSVNNIVVFSKSLEQVESKKTRIVRTGLKEEILRLKQEEGKDILVGGVDLPSQLIELGLVDELRVVVHPVIAGEGRRLFDDVILPSQLLFTLAGSQTFKSGSIALRYVKRQ